MVKTYSIQLLPPPDICDAIADFREKANLQVPSRREGKPCLYLQEDFRTRSIAQLSQDLAEELHGLRPFTIAWEGAEVLDKGTIAMIAGTSDSLRRLHEDIIEVVRSHRTPYHRPLYDRESFRDAYFRDSLHFGYLVLYGMPFSKEYYKPHLCLATRVHKKRLEGAVSLAQGLSLPAWTADQVILLSTDGALGQPSVVMQFPLQGTGTNH